MIRLLFVDDEQNILDGLARMLRPMRHEWQMDFALCAASALEKLAVNSYDVIVSDMRMPGMSGAQLLARVRDLYPDIVRIALSGHTDHEFIVHAISATHQFLAKPCEPATLKETIDRACFLRELIADPILRQRICRTQSVPSLGSVYELFIAELALESSSIARLGQIIAADIGLSAKVLQLVNSAFFGTPRHVCDPQEAASMLGLDTLRELAAAPQLFTIGSVPENESSDLDIWTESALTAQICRNIAQAESLPSPSVDAARLAGLLHRIGSLIVEEGPAASDAFAGAYILSLWGFPNEVIEAVGWCQEPQSSPFLKSMPLTILHAARVFANEYAGDGSALSMEIDETYLQSMGMLSRIQEWRQIAGDAVMSGVYK